MFSSDKNIETVNSLIAEVRKYIDLQKRSLQIDFVCKISKLISAMVIGSILFLLGAIILIFVSITLSSFLEPYITNSAGRYFILVGVYIMIGMLVYSKRQSWIEIPITNYIAQLFLSEQEDNGNDTEHRNP